MRIEAFTQRLPRPVSKPWLPQLEAALTVDGRPPLRWAIVAVEGDTLVVEGSRLCS